jgi:hypothetical protein
LRCTRPQYLCGLPRLHRARAKCFGGAARAHAPHSGITRRAAARSGMLISPPSKSIQPPSRAEQAPAATIASCLDTSPPRLAPCAAAARSSAALSHLHIAQPVSPSCSPQFVFRRASGHPALFSPAAAAICPGGLLHPRKPCRGTSWRRKGGHGGTVPEGEKGEDRPCGAPTARRRRRHPHWHLRRTGT